MRPPRLRRHGAQARLRPVASTTTVPESRATDRRRSGRKADVRARDSGHGRSRGHADRIAGIRLCVAGRTGEARPPDLSPWTVRVAGPQSAWPALEIYEAGILLDVMSSTRLAGSLLRGARTAESARGPCALAWGRLPAPGALLRADFGLGRRRPWSAGEVMVIGSWGWLAVAAGGFDAVIVSSGGRCARARLHRDGRDRNSCTGTIGREADGRDDVAGRRSAAAPGRRTAPHRTGTLARPLPGRARDWPARRRPARRQLPQSAADRAWPGRGGRGHAAVARLSRREPAIASDRLALARRLGRPGWDGGRRPHQHRHPDVAPGCTVLPDRDGYRVRCWPPTPGSTSRPRRRARAS